MGATISIQFFNLFINLDFPVDLLQINPAIAMAWQFSIQSRFLLPGRV
jgi:hypothetical protein